MPQVKGHTGVNGVPGVLGMPAVRSTRDGGGPVFEEMDKFISGVTRDATGAPLGNCAVCVYRSDMLPAKQPAEDGGTNCAARTVSDGSGNFSAGPLSSTAGEFFAVAWSSDGSVAGVTLKTLIPA